VVIVDQYIDLTRRRPSTFFEDGAVAHVSMADPTCPQLSRAAATAARHEGAKVHEGGTYLCIDGPQFSTRAESLLYRSWGVSVIGMTAMPEAKLAREAELPYATIAFATDYDCWHLDEAPVTVDLVLEVLRRNSDLAKRIVAKLSTGLPDPKLGPAHEALKHALITARNHLGAEARSKLEWLIGPHLKESHP
jgi:5'-methylthioadenosine phosphorylase